MKLSVKIKVLISLLKADYELKKAIRNAEKAFSRTGRRHYVIPDSIHRLTILSWADIKRMRRNGQFSSRCRQSDFMLESFYYTADMFGDRLDKAERRKKRKAWLGYTAQVCRLRKSY